MRLFDWDRGEPEAVRKAAEGGATARLDDISFDDTQDSCTKTTESGGSTDSKQQCDDQARRAWICPVWMKDSTDHLHLSCGLSRPR